MAPNISTFSDIFRSGTKLLFVGSFVATVVGERKYNSKNLQKSRENPGIIPWKSCSYVFLFVFPKFQEPSKIKERKRWRIR